MALLTTNEVVTQTCVINLRIFAFYVARLHDSDNNRKLDGLEIFHALDHSLQEQLLDARMLSHGLHENEDAENNWRSDIVGAYRQHIIGRCITH